MSTVNLVDIIIPGLVGRLSRWVFSNNCFPWTPVDIELIAFGSGAAVLKLNWRNGDNSDNELLELFAKNDCLREQFLYSARQTIRQWNERNTRFDF